MFVDTSNAYRISLLLLLFVALVLTACTQTAPAQTHTPSSDPVVRWIQQNAIPLQTTDPGGSDADLKSLKQIVGNASIVGLGEETHGTHEFSDIKALETYVQTVDPRQVYDLLQANRQNYMDQSSFQRFALALQNARIIVQFTPFFNSKTPTNYYQRDGFMAENVAWIRDHEAGSNPKIIVWAHDAQIANDISYPSQDGKNMGGELRARYHESYLPIGTTLYQGTYRIYDFPAGLMQTISPPATSTYNYTLGQAGLPLYLLDLRKIPSGPVSNWSLGSAIFLLYGLGGEDISVRAPLNQLFDVIIHSQNTTPSKLL
jgi:erythromycin esterase-like protein